MKRLIQFYYRQEQSYFLKASFLILISNLLGWLATIFYDFSQWEASSHHQSVASGGQRLPILLTVIFSGVLFLKMNRMDVFAKTRTPAASIAESKFKKIVAKYLVSYIEIATLFLIEGIFLVLLSGYSFQLVNILLFFVLLSGVLFSFATYFIFLPQIIKYYTSGVTNIFTKISYGTVLFLIFCAQGILRSVFSRLYRPLFFFDHPFYLVPSLAHLLVSLSIVWVYLKQKDGRTEGKKYV